MSAARRTTLVLAGLVLLSFNLRPAAVSVGPVLEEVRDALGMSGPEAGLLTSLPVLAFAVFGALAPQLARTVGVHRAAAVSLVAVVVGLGGRAAAGSDVTFLLLSAVALAGMATANVLLPSLVKLHFPDQIGRATAIYTTALATGLTSAFLLTVPISHAYDSWRGGLGVWAVTALVALVPWVALARTRPAPRARSPAASRSATSARTRIGWAMVLVFGLQSMQAYSIFGWFSQLWRDNGYDAGQAGAFVGIVAAVSIPISLWLPGAVARRENQVTLILSVLGCYLVGYAMLLVDAHTFAVPAAVLIGIGCCIFPLVLTLIGLRAHTPDGTAALSGFTQSLGLPDGGARSVPGGHDLRRDRGVDRTGVAAARPRGAPHGRRRLRRPPGVPRGPAALSDVTGTSGTVGTCRTARDLRVGPRDVRRGRRRCCPRGRGHGGTRRLGRHSLRWLDGRHHDAGDHRLHLHRDAGRPRRAAAPPAARACRALLGSWRSGPAGAPAEHPLRDEPERRGRPDGSRRRDRCGPTRTW